jgi:hypothetical protein
MGGFSYPWSGSGSGMGRVYVHEYGSGELIPAGEFPIDISTYGPRRQ